MYITNKDSIEIYPKTNPPIVSKKYDLQDKRLLWVHYHLPQLKPEVILYILKVLLT
jgi:hypothetical protein